MLERTLNSPWLYWPLSYQLKIGKWMLNLLTDRAFGRQTNLGGAATYAQLVKLHEDRMKNDPRTPRIFADNLTLFRWPR